ncbi:hypothetical protein SASPL_156719 [Salvia splendens]|uniref:Uncharacterized protein n=1 Tax=Salvia splendens TaxID=180675 RepID=A0A8X8YXI4_SALSN|nr:hypothetical protein SASPL_156719 [Salvia splendens]
MVLGSFRSYLDHKPRHQPPKISEAEVHPLRCCILGVKPIKNCFRASQERSLPNFSFMLKPITQLPPLASPSSQRKRSSDSSLDVSPINMFDSSRLIGFMPHQSRQLQGPSPKPPILSGGRDDLRPLAMLEESVKRLKSPKASPTYALSKEQVDAAFDLLADWFFEVCGSVTFSSLEHPKFTAFLKQVGMPEVSRRELLCSRLDSKFEEARRASEARIRDAAFFQVASDGWKSQICIEGDKRLVKFMVNLLMEPESSKRWSARTVKQCHRSMPRRSCGRPLEIFVVAMHIDVFRDSVVRNSFLKFRLQGVEVPAFITVPTTKRDISKNSGPFIAMLEGVLTCSQILRLVVLDDTFKVACLEDLAAAEVAGVVQDMRSKIKEWCTKCNVAEGPVERIVERRFKKNYHPAWTLNNSLPASLQGRRAHIALMELMKWRSEGLEPLYAQAVQLKQQDPVTGKMKIAHPQSSNLKWDKVGLVIHRLFGGQGASRLGFDKVQKLIFVAAHAKLERQDFSSVEENDAELLRSVNGEDEMLNEVLAQTSSI